MIIVGIVAFVINITKKCEFCIDKRNLKFYIPTLAI